MALKISLSRSCPAVLVRNLNRTAANPTPHPVTVAYSAVVAPISSLARFRGPVPGAVPALRGLVSGLVPDDGECGVAHDFS